MFGYGALSIDSVGLRFSPRVHVTRTQVRLPGGGTVLVIVTVGVRVGVMVAVGVRVGVMLGETGVRVIVALGGIGVNVEVGGTDTLGQAAATTASNDSPRV